VLGPSGSVAIWPKGSIAHEVEELAERARKHFESGDAAAEVLALLSDKYRVAKVYGDGRIVLVAAVVAHMNLSEDRNVYIRVLKGRIELMRLSLRADIVGRTLEEIRDDIERLESQQE
jgi:hypothetical protein